mgnify:CR=1 FL=1
MGGKKDKLTGNGGNQVKLIHFVETFHLVIGLTLTLLYLYQVAYLVLGLIRRRYRDKRQPSRLHRYAALISARNEEGVIGELIESLKQQNYPSDLLDIYVVADNCTDGTAQAAQAAGATVYRRFNRTEVGKGYALDYLLKKMAGDGLVNQYEAYLIFDADNIVDPNFVSEMNRVFDRGGFAAITSYRNSKNFGQNWITAGYSIWFLREAQFVNAARMALGLNCTVSGTGFLVSADLIREKGGWPYHLLTEDIQFSAECAAEGRRIGYCGGAVIYDEQPTAFRQSWDQRLRWSKGFYQVDSKYGLSLLRGVFRGGRQGLGCYDVLLTITPGILLAVLGALLQGLLALVCLSAPVYVIERVLKLTADFLFTDFLTFYRGMFLYGLLTVVSEWRYIRATPVQKLGYLFTFPLFMLTYIPISVAALFQKVDWKPIRHKSLAQIGPAA